MGDKPNQRKLGESYEEMAVEYFRQQGYEILERNYHNRFGEIDIIARDEGVLVIAEVKYRKDNNCGSPLEAVTFAKQRTICKTTLYYYMKHHLSQDTPCRFDVIGIYGDGRIEHVKNAFEFV